MSKTFSRHIMACTVAASCALTPVTVVAPVAVAAESIDVDAALHEVLNPCIEELKASPFNRSACEKKIEESQKELAAKKKAIEKKVNESSFFEELFTTLNINGFFTSLEQNYAELLTLAKDSSSTKDKFNHQVESAKRAIQKKLNKAGISDEMLAKVIKDDVDEAWVRKNLSKLVSSMRKPLSSAGKKLVSSQPSTITDPMMKNVRAGLIAVIVLSSLAGIVALVGILAAMMSFLPAPPPPVAPAPAPGV